MLKKTEVTLEELRNVHARFSSYNKLVCHLQNREFIAQAWGYPYLECDYDKPIKLLTLLDVLGLQDALWALSQIGGPEKEAWLYAVWCARKIEHLMPDKRSGKILNVVEQYLCGKAPKSKFDIAKDTALEIANKTVGRSADTVLWAVVHGYISIAAYSVAESIAYGNQGDAWTKVYVAVRDEQQEMFVKLCNGEAPWQLDGDAS